MSKSVHAAIVSAILLWSTGASAQPCQYDKDVTFKGEIYALSPGTSREFATLDRPYKDCVIIFMRTATSLPASCKGGSRFTVTGRPKRWGNGKGDDFEISKITCP